MSTIGDYDLGTARGTIELDASTLARTASALDLVGNKMLLLGTLAIAGFGYAVKSAADFEEQLSRFGAASNASESQMESLRKKALQLGQDSAYGATQVVEAFAELAYAGASTEEIVGGLGDAVVYLAAAGEIPLADASTTLINTMRQFNIPASEAVDIADELARAANASTVQIDDLNTSLRYVGPVAAAAGIDFKSTADALAVMGNEGIRGSTAGTSLRGILVGITKPSEQATAKMKELGIITADGANQFFKADGSMKNFRDIAQILQDTTKGLTKEQQLNAFGTIFQRRAMATAAVLAKEGAAGFDKLTASAQYNTTAQEIMKKKLDNLKGSLKILKASVETAAITIGELFTPYLKSAADAIREAVNWFIKLPSPVKKAVGLVLVLGGGFLILGGALSKTIGLATKSYKAFVDLAKALQLVTVAEGEADAAFAVSPFGLVVLAVLALAAAIYFVWKYWDQIWKFISDNPYIAIIIGLLMPFIATLILAVGAIKYLYENWDRIWPKLKEIAKGVIDWLVGAWVQVKESLRDAVNWVGEAVDNITGFFKRLYEDVKNWIGEAVDNVVGFFQRLPGVIVNGVVAAANAIIDFVSKIPGWFQYALFYALGFIIGFLVSMVANFINGGIQVITWLIGFVSSFVSTVVDWGVQFLSAVVDFMIQLPGIIVGVFFTVLGFLANFVTTMVTGAINMGIGVVMAVLTFFSQLPGIIAGALLSALGFMFGFIGSMINAMITTGAGVVLQAWSFFTRLPGIIVDAISGIPGQVLSIGQNIINSLIHGVESGANHLKHLVSDLADSIVDGFKDALSIFSPSKVMKGIGKNVVQGLVIGMQNTAPALSGPITAMTDAIKGVGDAAAYTGPYASPVGVGSTTNDSRQTVVNQDITIQALNSDELARRLTAERDWALRTAKVA